MSDSGLTIDLSTMRAVSVDVDRMHRARRRRPRAAVRDLEPWIGTGVYPNMLNFDEMHRVVEAFGVEKYARLGRVKAQYDPGNLFQMNYNVKPVTS